jgi:hypothetical protein
MADLRTEGDELVLHLRSMEKAEGFHGDIRVPLSVVRAVETPGPSFAASVLRAPGSRM